MPPVSSASPFHPDEEVSASSNWIRYGILLVLALGLLVPGTGTLPLMDRDEPRFGQATWEMMETEQWTIPYFNGDYRFDKPPLTYWWMRVHYWIFGKGELGARLHSVFAAWLAAVALCRMGEFFYSRKAGFLAGIGFLTCLQVLIHGRLCVADMPMILAVIAIMDASSRLLFRPEGRERTRRFGGLFWYLVAALAFGFLAKGPIAWAVPMLAWVLFRWPIGKKPLPWGNLQLLSGFAIALAIVGLWGIPAIIQTRGEFYEVGIGEHVIDRGLKPLNNRVVIPGVYYLGTVLLSLLPWSAFAYIALFRGESPRIDSRRAILLAWYIAPFLIFSFYQTQLPHYILPGFGGLFLLLFRSGTIPKPESPGENRWFWGVTGFFAAIVLAAAALLLLRGGSLPAPGDQLLPIFWLGWSVVTLVSVVAPLLIRFAPGERFLAGAGVVLAVGAAFLVLALTGGIRDRHPVMQVRGALEKYGIEGPIEFSAFGFAEPSLVYYLDSEEPWEFVSRVRPIDRWLDEESESTRVAVYRTKVWKFDKLFAGGDFPPVVDDTAEVLASIEEDRFVTEIIQGFNAARTTWEELVVVIPREAAASGGR